MNRKNKALTLWIYGQSKSLISFRFIHIVLVITGGKKLVVGVRMAAPHIARYAAKKLGEKGGHYVYR